MSTVSELSSLSRNSSPSISNDSSQATQPNQSSKLSQANKPQSQISINDLQKQRKQQLQDIKVQIQIEEDEKLKCYNLYQVSLSKVSKLKEEYNLIDKFYKRDQKKISGIKRQRKQYTKEIKELLAESVNQKNMPRKEASKYYNDC
ncbi:hypothetical protein CONCODRAFT_71999 [Conidiobolus coronatus NRRL 28638]|uniref:Uncharacterized protein n=1 Tax=Conidiobolus coronatus (strain ATCC 28846 / CBS 209.66 / NRRL 28638) TaxID=796925 RepID=A0A137P128_CONC2|nr:hypothetical protein CONCODRAFT_71999 [Conidiobolus coronatus NRRL 28638]|eukprot:KXN68776.1 hypothetical protein CONCODRAFT_71999 [Conidiobolus coronatus NRRL 28638]